MAEKQARPVKKVAVKSEDDFIPGKLYEFCNPGNPQWNTPIVMMYVEMRLRLDSYSIGNFLLGKKTFPNHTHPAMTGKIWPFGLEAAMFKRILL